jgi:hypothetical protein
VEGRTELEKHEEIKFRVDEEEGALKAQIMMRYDFKGVVWSFSFVLIKSDNGLQNKFSCSLTSVRIIGGEKE